MQIYIGTYLVSHTRTIVIEVNGTDTIGSGLDKALERIDVPKVSRCDNPVNDSERFLLLGGKILEDDRTFDDYGITKDQTLKLNSKFIGRGGYCFLCIVGKMNLLNVAETAVCDSEMHSEISADIDTKIHLLQRFFGVADTSLTPLLSKRSQAVLLQIAATLCIRTAPTLEDRRAIYTLSNNLIGSFSSATYETVENYRNEKLTVGGANVLIKLHQERCPICFERFRADTASRNCPCRICSLSDLHSICRGCIETMGPHSFCPICRSATQLCAVSDRHVELLKGFLKELRDSCMFSTDKKSDTVQASDNFTLSIDGLHPIGCGSFCDVYKYNSEEDVVALKIPRIGVAANENSQLEISILHEVAVAMPVSHIKYFVSVLGIVNIEGRGVGIAMEFIQGPNLADALANKIIVGLDMETRIKVCRDICHGVAELHAAGIIHRDLKPENIMLQLDDEHVVAKLTDFGISTLIQTASGSIGREKGTLGYMSPESCEEDRDTKPKTSADIYALSLIIFEVLNARRVFTGLTNAQVMMQYTIRGKRPDWNAELLDNTILPDFIRNVVEKGWDPDPLSRPSASDFIFALNENCDFYDMCSRSWIGMDPLPEEVTTDAMLEYLSNEDERNAASREYLVSICKRLQAGDVNFIKAVLQSM